MKILIIVFISIIVSGCTSNTKQPSSSSYKQKTYAAKKTNKGNFDACANKGVIVDLFAKHRDAGRFVPTTKEYLLFDKIREGKSTVAKRILRIVNNSPSVKPDVLSAAFAVHCYSPALYSPHQMPNMNAYAFCNKYSGNTLAIGTCVRRTAGVNVN